LRITGNEFEEVVYTVTVDPHPATARSRASRE